MKTVHIEVYEDGTKPHYYTIKDEAGVAIFGVQAMAIGVSVFGPPFMVDMILEDGSHETALLGSLRGFTPLS